MSPNQKMASYPTPSSATSLTDLLARPNDGPSPLAQPEIEAIWIRAAAALGFGVERTDEAYASTDGRGTIFLGADAILDADDAVAQLVFHELCHGLVEGPASWSLPDWSFAADDSEQVVREHACLRVQIALATPFGLRNLLAPTTVHRAYHDGVAADALAGVDDPAAALARAALSRTESARWLPVLRRALADTARALTVSAATSGDASGARDALLLAQARTPATALPDAAAHSGPPGVAPPTPPTQTAQTPAHPTGLAWGPADRACGDCAWLHRGGRGRAVHRCRQSARTEADAGIRVEATTRACARFEPPVDCQDCGACCREAYHSVTVAMRDPVVWKQPELIVRHGHRFEIRRTGDRCAALEEQRHHLPVLGAEARQVPVLGAEERRSFACRIYEDRPRPCREFEAGGRHCLVARRRVGLSLG